MQITRKMKYYLIAGEASGDLHASHLMRSLSKADGEAQFRFFGGDNMLTVAKDCTAVGSGDGGDTGALTDGPLVKHYRDLAYMGFIPVLLHLRTILKGMDLCKKDILAWQPDCVIFVDYAGFNLKIAKWLHALREKSIAPQKGGWSGALYYYIAPKIWAWKEGRIKNFKRDIDEMFSILPFEKEFFEGKHQYPIHYVGNPTADEVRNFKNNLETPENIKQLGQLEPLIALLAGSRRQEIKGNLPVMLEAINGLPSAIKAQYRFVLAGAPGIEPDFYREVISGEQKIEIVFGKTYELLSQATAALVTSGTATLETACFNVPQVVCYKVEPARIARWGFEHILKCRFISLVNLIADEEVVPELFADKFTAENIRQHLLEILPPLDTNNASSDSSVTSTVSVSPKRESSPKCELYSKREAMLAGYQKVHARLGSDCAPDNAANIMVKLLR